MSKPPDKPFVYESEPKPVHVIHHGFTGNILYSVYDAGGMEILGVPSKQERGVLTLMFDAEMAVRVIIREQ